MAAGRGRDEWTRTATLVTYLAACHGAKIDPRSVSPYERPSDLELNRDEAAKMLFAVAERAAVGKQGK